MHALGHTLTVLAGVLLLPACLLVTVDLRSGASGDGQTPCGLGERRNPASGECEACIVLPPPPGDCLCDWAYRPSGFPYCDVAEAYYGCLTCEDSIYSCNDLTPVVTPGVVGVTRDCARVRACCDDLAGDHPHRADCCPCGASLRCDLDPADPESAQYLVRCDPEPGCHGVACPNGAGDCQSFQTCEAGECTPACNPVSETCSLEAGCACEAVPP